MTATHIIPLLIGFVVGVLLAGITPGVAGSLAAGAGAILVGAAILLDTGEVHDGTEGGRR